MKAEIHVRRVVVAVLAAALLATGGTRLAAADPEVDVLESTAATSPSGLNCRDYQFPVHVPAVADEMLQVFGQLCGAEELTADTPVQVLLHGGTYDHAYWDWPYQSQQYSYVRHAVAAGHATLNLDRLGYGNSSRPDPQALDFDAGGQAVRQVVQQLRAGALGARPETVILNGHSMGGLVAEAAAEHGGADAVIVSGISPGGRGDADSSADADTKDPMYPFHPAEDDPKFADQPWAAGYLTTLPDTRAEAFHYPGTYDPAVLPVEEELKDTLASAELEAVRPSSESPRSEQPQPAAGRDIPVAYVLGRHDVIACADADCLSDPDAEDADYVVADSGHSINVSKGATAFYEWTFEWIEAQLGC